MKRNIKYNFFPHLNQQVLGLGSSLAISHQLLLTFPVGEENSSQSVKQSHRDESLLHGNTTCVFLRLNETTVNQLKVGVTLPDAK